MKCWKWMSAAVASLLMVASAWAVEVSVDKLPAAVRSAIEQRFPKAEFLAADQLEDSGRTKYDVEIRYEGKRYEVEIWNDGRIIDIDRDLG